MRHAAKDLIAGDGGTNEAFNVRIDQIIAGEVICKRPATRVVHAVGQISHQYHIET